MTFAIVNVEVVVMTDRGLANYSAQFGLGLNVLNAPNSWGKSTLLQCLIFGLGLEGALTTSRRSPLGPAMTTRIQTKHGLASVSESWVAVSLTNDRGQALKVKRYSLSADVGQDLVQVWRSDTYAGLERAPRVDMFVRVSGGATHELGFHRLLEQFIGLTLPSVPTFNERDATLYLEVLIPLFYIEQKLGWAGIAPRIPTHFRIREPLRRAVEFVLGLSTLERIREREAIREDESELARRWSAAVARANAAAGQVGLRVVGGQDSPVGRSYRQDMLIEASDGGEWYSLADALGSWTARLAELGDDAHVEHAGARTDASRAELLVAEREVDERGAVVTGLREQVAYGQADMEALSSRLREISRDKQRLSDAKTIQRLGGEHSVSLVAEGVCPTCSQDLDGRAVVTGHVSSLEDNIRQLDSERLTLSSMLAAARERSQAVTQSLAVAEAELRDARDRMRLLKDELAGPSAAPSIAQVQQRLALANRIQRVESAIAIVEGVDEELDDLAVRVDEIRARRAVLRDGADSPDDVETLNLFERSFKEQIAAYGLSSLPPHEVMIDRSTLLPSNDGFELVFDVQMGMSASDTIRTRWAYHTALLETAVARGGHHPGVVILDEPRQQETHRQSLAAFLARLKMDGSLAQVIYATSESPDVLAELLQGIPHTRVPSNGEHLIEIA